MCDYKPTFSPSAESIEWSGKLKILWFIDIGLLAVSQIFNFNVLGLVIGVLLLWLYYYIWKSMNPCATIIGIVFKMIGLLLNILLILMITVLAGSTYAAYQDAQYSGSFTSMMQDFPNRMVSYYSESSLGIMVILAILLYVVYIIYQVICVVFFCKAHTAFSNDERGNSNYQKV